MLNVKKDNRFRNITILFMVLFVFLKVSQYYNPEPIMVRRSDHTERGYAKFNLNIQRVSYSRLMDKCAIELKDESLVPKIKFSGTVIYLFFSAILLPPLKYYKVYVYEPHRPTPIRLCTKLCTFRL